MLIEITPKIIEAQANLLHGNLREFNFKSKDYEPIPLEQCYDLLAKTYGIKRSTEWKKIIDKLKKISGDK